VTWVICHFFILLVVAALFYFGKLITSVKIEQYQKENYYIEGFFFSFFYIGIPFIVILALFGVFTKFLPTFGLPVQLTILGLVLVQAIIAGILTLVITFNISRFSLFSQLKPAYKKAYETERKKKHIIVSAEEVTNRVQIDLGEGSFELQTKLANKVCKPTVIFFLSLLIGWSVYSTYIHQPASFILSSLDTTIIIYTLAFVNFTLLALAYGYINLYPPPAKIYLDNGEIVTGESSK